MHILLNGHVESDIERIVRLAADLPIDELEGGYTLVTAHNHALGEKLREHYPFLPSMVIPNAGPRVFVTIVEQYLSDRKLPQAAGFCKLWWRLRSEEFKQVLMGEAPGEVLSPEVAERMLMARS